MAFIRTLAALTRARNGVKGAVLLTGLCLALPAGRAAGTGSGVKLNVTIGNATGAVLQCQALAAHWYSLPLREVPPGGSVVMQFTFVPARGEVTAEPESTLPIEVLYCGRAGAAWATRSEIDLRGAAAQASDGTVRIICADQGEALACGAAP